MNTTKMLKLMYKENQGCEIIFPESFQKKYLEYEKLYLKRESDIRKEIERINETKLIEKEYLIEGLNILSQIVKADYYTYSVCTHRIFITNKIDFFSFIIKKHIPYKLYCSCSQNNEFVKEIIKMEINEIVKNAVATIDVKDKDTIKVFLKDLSSSLRLVEGNPEEEIEKAERILGISLTEKQKNQVENKYKKNYDYDEEKSRTMNSYANTLDVIVEALE